MAPSTNMSEYTIRQQLVKRLNEELRKNKLPSKECDIVVVLTLEEVKVIIESLHGEMEILQDVSEEELDSEWEWPMRSHKWKDDSFHKDE